MRTRLAVGFSRVQTVTGITTAFDTFVTAMSIAYGLMVSTIVLPRHFTSVALRRGGS